MKILLALPASLALAACAVDAPVASPGDEVASQCNAAPAQYHIGHEATAAMGAAIQKDSGAATLRWGPPNSAWTMDMRPDRVNVRYDEAMKITEITCG